MASSSDFVSGARSSSTRQGEQKIETGEKNKGAKDKVSELDLPGKLKTTSSGVVKTMNKRPSVLNMDKTPSVLKLDFSKVSTSSATSSIISPKKEHGRLRSLSESAASSDEKSPHSPSDNEFLAIISPRRQKKRIEIRQIRQTEDLIATNNLFLTDFHLKTIAENNNRLELFLRSFLVLEANLTQNITEQDPDRGSVGINIFGIKEYLLDESEIVSPLHAKLNHFFLNHLLDLHKEIPRKKDCEKKNHSSNAGKLVAWLGHDHLQDKKEKNLKIYREHLGLFIDRLKKEKDLITPNSLPLVRSEENLYKGMRDDKLPFPLRKMLNELNRVIDDSFEIDQSVLSRSDEFKQRYEEVINTLQFYTRYIDEEMLKNVETEATTSSSLKLKQQENCQSSLIAVQEETSGAVTGLNSIHTELLNGIIDDLADLKKKIPSLNDLKTKPQEIQSIKEKLYALIADLNRSSTSKQKTRRLSVGFNFTDISSLIPGVVSHSKEHVFIESKLKEFLVYLSKDMPTLKTTRGANFTAMLNWMEKEEFGTTKIATLLNFKRAVNVLIDLLKITQASFQIGDYPQELFLHEIVEKANEMKISLKVVEIFNKINVALLQAANDYDPQAEEEDQFNQFVIVCNDRYPEIIKLLEKYLIHIDNSVFKLLETIKKHKGKPYSTKFLERGEALLKTLTEKDVKSSLIPEIVLVRSLKEIAKAGQLGKVESVLINPDTHPIKSTEWEYFLEHGALKIWDNQNKLFYPKSTINPELPSKDEAANCVIITKEIKGINTFISSYIASFEEEKIKNALLQLIKKLQSIFFNQKLSETMTQDELKSLLEDLGLKDLFGQKISSLFNFYSETIAAHKSDIDKEVKIETVIQSYRKKFGEDFEKIQKFFHHFVLLSTVDQWPYDRFEHMGMLLEFVSENTQNPLSGPIAKVLFLHKLANQQLLYINKDPIASLFQLLRVEGIAPIRTGNYEKSSKDPNKKKLSKKMELSLEKKSVKLKTTTLHNLALSNGSVSSEHLFFRERYELTIPPAKINQPEDWTNDYSGTIIIKKKTLTREEKVLIEDLETALVKGGISYTVVRKY